MSRKSTFNKNMRYVTFIMTYNCNLSCSYCYEHNKRNYAIDVNFCKKTIEQEANADDGYKEICFDFFGGEPFLEFDKIREIVESTKDKIFKKKIYFFAGTNGTLINDTIKKWLLQNRDIFQIALSLDGTRAMHNKNRSNSYDLIPIDFFINYFKNLTVKATISPQTIDTLAEGVIHLHKLGFNEISCNLAVGQDWASTKYESILYRELNKLIDYYLENKSIKPCNLLEYNIEYVAHPHDGKAFKYCGAGTRTKVFDVDGTVYPCQYFLPLTLGEGAQCVPEIHFSDIIDLSVIDKECQKCIAVNICPSCYGSNYQETGNIYERDKAFCRLQKIIILANSYFKARQWEKGLLTLDEYQKQELLVGIMNVQNNIKI